MISILIEAALRSLLVGLVVAIGLRVFRVRNVPAQKAAWGLVLLAAFAMPLLRPITARWHILPAGSNILMPAHPMTLLEELQAKILADAPSGSKAATRSVSVSQGNSPWAEKPSISVPRPAQNPDAKVSAPEAARAQQKQRAAAPARREVNLAALSHTPSHRTRVLQSFPRLALVLYLGIAALLVFRLLLGLVTTLRLWVTAAAIPGEAVSASPSGCASGSVPESFPPSPLVRRSFCRPIMSRGTRRSFASCLPTNARTFVKATFIFNCLPASTPPWSG